MAWKHQTAAKDVLRALKSPQKFRTPSSANFLGSWHVSWSKLKSYYEIWTLWSKLGLQMLPFHSWFEPSWFFATVCKEHYKLISGTKRNCHQRNAAAGMLLLLQYQMLPLVWCLWEISWNPRWVMELPTFKTSLIAFEPYTSNLFCKLNLDFFSSQWFWI